LKLDLEPEVGDILNDRYKIIKMVGKGSYGAVFAAQDLSLGSLQVALKVLYPKMLKHQNATRRLSQEIQAANRIDHENIVRFYDFFKIGELCVIAMEYVEGSSLRSCIDDGLLKENFFLITDLMIQICMGLGVIHRHGIIHRDIKPDNILIVEENRAKIADFGIAYLLEGESELSSSEMLRISYPKKQLVGTMRYISPESISIGQYDQRSDIYAVGVILYEMITEKYFFKYKNFKELMQLKVEKDPIAPSIVVEDCPELLESICLKALSRDPDLRYQSTDDMLVDLRYLRSELENTLLRKRSKKAKYKRLKITLFCLLGFLLLILFFVIMVLSMKLLL